MQASCGIVGHTGFVLGVDLKRIESMEQLQVRTIVGDIRDSQITHFIKQYLPRRADVLISDVSPNVSGIWELDHARQIDLARHSLRIALSLLRPNGSFFVKVFQGDMLNKFVEEVRQRFSFVRLVKPKASRSKSSELYVLGMHLHPSS